MNAADRDESEFRRKINSYGRRKGKTLRRHHAGLMETMYPRLAVDPAILKPDPLEAFPAGGNSLWLEVGFGGGEHLADCAAREAETRFIGCEPFINGVAKLLAEIEARRLSNIRIFAGDAAEVLDELPDECLSGVYILYPDPWPKARQKKRRFISPENLRRLARVMKPGSELRFATDIDDYSAWTLSRVLNCRSFEWRAKSHRDWLVPWRDWSPTRYEAKAVKEGRPPAYFTFVRNNKPA